MPERHVSVDKMPKPNLLAERELVGCVLRDPKVVAEACATVPADAFGNGRLAAIWNAIGHLHQEGIAVDLPAVATRLGKTLIDIGGAPYLVEIFEGCLTSANWRQRASEVLVAANRRRLFCVAMDLYNDCVAGGDPATIAQTAKDRLYGAIVEQDALRPIPISQTISEVLGAITERHAKKVGRGISTGIIPLDEYVGGMEPGAIYVLAARPGNGKSVLSMQICASVAATIGPALFFSLEMTAEQLVERLLSSGSGIENSRIRKGLLRPEELTQLVDASMVVPPDLQIWDAPKCPVSRIEAAVARQVSDKQPALVVVDYLQLIEPANRRDQRDEQIAGSMRGLKIMAKRWKVPLLLVSQLNREVEGRNNATPRLADLRGSGSIEQDADFVMFIHPKPSSSGEDVKPSNNASRVLMRLTVAKSRHGKAGEIDLEFNRPTVSFKPVIDAPASERDF